jgi:hypothetical protein
VRTRRAKALLAIGRDHRVLERFWSSVEQSVEPNGCWEWKGWLKPGGYPAFQIGQQSIAAPYVTWFWSTGDLPLGGRLHQTCDNSLCVRPSHLAWSVGRVMMRRLAAESDGYIPASSNAESLEQRQFTAADLPFPSAEAEPAA